MRDETKEKISESMRDAWRRGAFKNRKCPRIGKTHLDVTERGGFGGKCLPKDIEGLIAKSEELGYNPKFLKEIWKANKRFRK